MIVAFVLARFSKIECDSIGADGWRPLSTIVRVVPLLPLSCPQETGAAGAIGATAAPLGLVKTEDLFAAGTVRISIGADISAFPKQLAPIDALGELREKKKKGEEEE